MQSSIKELQFYFSQQTSEGPLIDLYETENDLVFEVDLPGINPDDILIKAFNDLLVIEGIKADYDQQVKTHKFLCMERCMDNFRSVVKIPVQVDLRKGKASYSHGVVKITFPKVKQRIVKIKINKQEGD